MTKSLYALPFVLFACASEVPEESTTSTSELRCPSPTEDREGFIACVKKKASAGQTSGGTKGGNSSGNGGTSSASDNGGNIQIGDINSGGGRCSNLSISCTDGRCTCQANGGPEKACNGSDCDEVCCP